MSDDNWFHNAPTEAQLKEMIEELDGVEHVKVLREFVIMRDTLAYNVYFCDSNGDRRRITVELPGDSDDYAGLVRAFQDQLISKSEN